MTFKSPETEQEWAAYYQLRWQILRAPWQQAPGSERDTLEDTAFHIMATDRDQVIGVGRIHRVDASSAQIRYMAVDLSYQGRGIGSQLLAQLEQAARHWDCHEIVLNARTVSLAFYLKHGYQVIADGQLLFGSVAHKRMTRQLR